VSVYLDIETDGGGRIVVVGFYARGSGLVQLVGRDVTPSGLLRSLPACRRLFTFNGHSFDLPLIRRRLGLDLRLRYQSIDLRHCCARAGWRGGQKAIERRLGIVRRLPGLDGRDALVFWSRYHEGGDAQALSTLLLYNREDVMNMVKIRAALRRAGVPT
jgi:uncharacterized protein YprB with RNaseH-like and TPR domain